jgi:3-deoxy-D-manno-octulosonic-acid transferase
VLILYNLLFIFGFLIASPFFFVKLLTSDKWRDGLKMRFGFYGSRAKYGFKHEKTLWVHASSVGEVKAVIPLVKEIQKSFPKWNLVVTTVTRTGNRVAKNLLPNVIILYFPLDFLFIVKRAIRLIQPNAVILVESELWANFLAQIYRKKIPVALINVRMSKRSFKRYGLMKFFVHRFVEKLSLITTPTKREAIKIKLLGGRPEHIHIVGNLKYENVQLDGFGKLEKLDLLRNLGFPENSVILLGGSTHPGEEEILLNIYEELLKHFPNLHLVLVPRHPERRNQVSSEVEKRGFSYQLKTELDMHQPHQVLILDTVGELERTYAIADVVFIGKSLTKKGGQNFLEPARLGKCVVFGPHMESFEDMAATFVEQNGALQVQDEKDLRQGIQKLLESSEQRKAMGQKAREIIAMNQGSLQETLSLISQVLLKE